MQYILIVLLFLFSCESTYYSTFEKVRGNKARGEVTVTINSEDTILKWDSNIQGLSDITAMHIHCKPSDAVGVTLRPSLVKGQVLNYANSLGIATEPDWGNKCGWKNIADVRAAIKKEQAYVNVHTSSAPAGALQATLLRPIATKSFLERLDDIRH